MAFDLDARFPNTYAEIKKLKGVGDYTASAIASICFDEAEAVVDGNVYRVLSRVFGIDTPIDSTSGKKEFKALAQQLIDPKDPATFNQALMEFGATQCKPKNPYCLHCPFQQDCLAYASGKINELPVKQGKTKVRDRYFNYLIVLGPSGETILRQRDKKGIWGGLFEFPLLETEKPLKETRFRESVKKLKLPGAQSDVAIEDLNEQSLIALTSEAIIHKLSHQKLHVHFWLLKLKEVSGLQTIHYTEFETYAVPRVIDRFMEDFDFKQYL